MKDFPAEFSITLEKSTDRHGRPIVRATCSIPWSPHDMSAVDDAGVSPRNAAFAGAQSLGCSSLRDDRPDEDGALIFGTSTR